MTEVGGYVLIGDGNAGSFSGATPTPFSDARDKISDAEILDFNGDGVPDLLLAPDDGKPRVYLGDPLRPGDFSLTRHEVLPVPEDLKSPKIAIFDAEGTGAMDIWFTNMATDTATTGFDYGFHASDYTTAIPIGDSNTYISTGVVYNPGEPPSMFFSPAFSDKKVVFSSLSGYHEITSTTTDPTRPFSGMYTTSHDQSWGALGIALGIDPGLGTKSHFFVTNNDASNYLGYEDITNGGPTDAPIGTGTGPRTEVVGIATGDVTGDGTIEVLIKTDGGQILVVPYSGGGWSNVGPTYLNSGNMQSVSSEAEDSDGLGLVAPLRGDSTLSFISSLNLGVCHSNRPESNLSYKLANASDQRCPPLVCSSPGPRRNSVERKISLVVLRAPAKGRQGTRRGRRFRSRPRCPSQRQLQGDRAAQPRERSV